MVGMTVMWSYNYFSFVNQYSEGVRSMTFTTIETFVSNNLKIPPAVSGSLSSLLDTNARPNNYTFLSYLENVFAETLTHVDGDFLALDVVSYDSGTLEQRLFVGSSDDAIYTELVDSSIRTFSLNASGNVNFADSISVAPANVPAITSTLLAEATLDGPGGVWKEPYFSCRLGSSYRDCIMYIEQTSHIFHGPESWLGTVRVSIAGRTLSAFLAEVTRPDAECFIVDLTNLKLIAASTVLSESGVTNSLGYYPNAFTSEPILYDVLNYQHSEILSAVAPDFVSAYQSSSSTANNSTRTFSTSGYTVDWVVLPTFNWALVHAIPSSAFTTSPTIYGGVAGGVSGLVVILSVSLTLGVLSCIIRPLRSLMGQMEYVMHMQLDQVVGKASSWLVEIRAIQTSFVFMIEELRKYRAFLPEEMLMEEEEGDENGNDAYSVSGGSNLSSSGKSFLSLGKSVLDGIILQTPRGRRDSTTSAAISPRSRRESARGSGHASDTSDGFSEWGASTTYSAAQSHRSEDRRELMFRLGLLIESSSIVIFDWSNVEHFMPQNEPPPDEFLHVHRRIVEEVRASILRFKGVLMRFDHRCFVARFDGIRSSSRAVGCWWQVNSAVEKWDEGVEVVAGISSGMCYIGNLGCDRVKNKVVVGSSMELAERNEIPPYRGNCSS